MALQTTPRKSATLYKRSNVTSTIKEGWRVGDISVSVTWEEGNEVAGGVIDALYDEAHAEAQAFCDRKNADRDQTTRFTNTSKG